MKTAMDHEQRFLEMLDTCTNTSRNLAPHLFWLQAWLGQLCDDLHASSSLDCVQLRQESPLARLACDIHARVLETMQTWIQQSQDLMPAHAVADAFEDKLMLLMFGKLNAGKSSLCNFLAKRFAACGKTVRYFHIDDGRVVTVAQ
jgi:hypothetical protein